ncbi:hypothetical protein [Alistipes sp.]|uniref:hypothetical protein n=1 Tax=Alistipes sp. TaxID=1872444 RepID=UPI003AB6A996
MNAWINRCQPLPSTYQMKAAAPTTGTCPHRRRIMGLSACSQKRVRGAVIRHSVQTVRPPSGSSPPQTGQREG